MSALERTEGYGIAEARCIDMVDSHQARGEREVMTDYETVSTDQLQKGMQVLMGPAMQEWRVVGLPPDGSVVISRQGRLVNGSLETWRVAEYPKDAAQRTDLMTVQMYLLSIGLPAERLQTQASGFGKAMANAFRKKYGKDVQFNKLTEYVEYLDGDYESNAYGPEDAELFEQVRTVRLPKFMVRDVGAHEACEEADPEEEVQRAIGILTAHGLTAERVQEVITEPGVDLVWLTERQMARCLLQPVPCGHEECRRRARNRRSEPRRRSPASGGASGMTDGGTEPDMFG